MNNTRLEVLERTIFQRDAYSSLKETSQTVKLCCQSILLQFSQQIYLKSCAHFSYLNFDATGNFTSHFQPFFPLAIVSCLPRDTQVSRIESPSDVGYDEFLPVKNEAQGTVL